MSRPAEVRVPCVNHVISLKSLLRRGSAAGSAVAVSRPQHPPLRQSVPQDTPTSQFETSGREPVGDFRLPLVDPGLDVQVAVGDTARMSHRRGGLGALVVAALAAVLWVGPWLSIDWWEAHLTAVVPVALIVMAPPLAVVALVTAAFRWRSVWSWLAIAIVGSIVGLSAFLALTDEVK
jgi:hypothetical protein